jgi:CRISPR-associated protein Cas2
MSATKRWRLICYDIRTAARWRKVYRIVRGAGERVQYSIFRCRLDDRETEKVKWELSQVMAKEDALLVVDLCPKCAGNVVARNHVDGWDVEPAAFRIIGGGGREQASEVVSDEAVPELAEDDE